MSDAGKSARARRRNRKYGLSLLTSVASKVSTTAIQLVSLPLVIANLGPQSYVLYAMLVAMIGWLYVANLGLGPSLAISVAKNSSRGDVEHERQLVSSAFFSNLAFTLIILSICVISAQFIDLTALFGPQFADRGVEISQSLAVLALIYVLNSNLVIFESVQTGHQDQYVVNAIMTVGALATIAGIYLMATRDAGIVMIIIAMFFPQIIARFVNLAIFLWRHRPAVPRLGNFRPAVFTILAKDGAIYALAGSAGNFLAHVLPIILVGSALAAPAAASFAAMMQAVTLLSGIVAMLTAPLQPAFAESHSSGDWLWAQRAFRNVSLAATGFSLAAAAILIFGGKDIFRLWSAGNLTPNPALLLSAALYFVVGTRENLVFCALIGMGRFGSACVPVFVRCLTGIALMYPTIADAGEAAPFFIMAATTLLISVVPMEWMLRRSPITKSGRLQESQVT